MNKDLKYNYLTIDFDDYSDFLKEAEKEPSLPEYAENHSRTGSESFTETKDFQSALDLAKNGWKQGLDKVEELRAEIAPLIGEKVLRPTPVHSMAGYAPNVGAFLSGDPENMYYREYQEVKACGKILKIGVSGSFSCGVDSSVIFKRGAILAALIDAIEQTGIYQVELFLDHATGRGERDGIEGNIKLKESGEPFDIGKFAFCIAHPSQFRRLFFSVMENNGFNQDWDYGYGAPMDSKSKSSFDLYFKSLHWEVIKSNENAVSWVLSQLKDLGIQITDT